MFCLTEIHAGDPAAQKQLSPMVFNLKDVSVNLGESDYLNARTVALILGISVRYKGAK